MEDNKIIDENFINNNKSSTMTEFTCKYQTRKKYIDFAKIGEKLSLTGSNCHLCKSIMTVGDSNACRFSSSSSKSNNKNHNTNTTNKNTNNKQGKKKTCNKKFCYDCLKKHFPSYYESRFNKDWKCPCCFNECYCGQCKKNIIKGKKELENIPYNDDLSLDSDINLNINQNLNKHPKSVMDDLSMLSKENFMENKNLSNCMALSTLLPKIKSIEKSVSNY